MTSSAAQKGVYVSLEDLIKLKYQATGFSFLPRQPIHSLLSGRHASRLRGRGMDFEELRRYLPGDDIRNIDWKVTARTRKPHTRVFTEERERPVILVVDQRICMFFGTRVSMKSVTAAELAAIGAWRVVDTGDRVGAIVFNDTNSTEIAPHRSSSRVMQILSELVKYNSLLHNDPDIHSNPKMLNSVLRKVSHLAPHDFLVGIISDFYGMDDETRRLVKLISQHNDVIVSMIYDPMATQPPEKAKMVVGDGVTQIEVDSTRLTDRMDLVSIFQDRLNSLQTELVKFGVPVLPIHTAEPAMDQLRQLIGKRL